MRFSKILFLIAYFASSSIFAQEMPTSPKPPAEADTAALPVSEKKNGSQIQIEPSRDLEKLSYLPAPGIAYVEAGFIHTVSKGSVNAPAGNYYDFKGTATDFKYLLSYGLSDYLALGIQGEIGISEKNDYTFGSGSTIEGTTESLKSSGWKEPEIAFRWRVRDNTESKVRIHILGGVTPKLQDAKYATSTNNGNKGIGGPLFNLGIQFFKEVRNLEFSFGFKKTLKAVTTRENASDSTKKSEADEHQSTDFNIGIQNNASDDFAVGGNLEFHMEDSYTVDFYTNGNPTSKTSYDDSTASAIEVFGKFRIEDQSILKLSIGQILNMSQSLKVGTTKLDSKLDSATAVQLTWIQEF